MKKITQQPKDANNFLRLGRSLIDDLRSGHLTVLEFAVLIYLKLLANPHTGTIRITAKQVVSDLSNEGFDQFRDSTNKATKVLHNLRKKQKIWFAKHQGRSPSDIEIGEYPLIGGNYLDIGSRFGGDASRSLNQTHGIIQHDNNQRPAEAENFQQKLETAKKLFIKRSSFDGQRPASRSPNEYTDTENDKFDNRTIKEERNDRSIDTNNFEPKTSEEYQCKEIATNLGEKDMRFILSRLKKYGLDPIEKAWGMIKEDRSGKIQNPRAYFNKLVNEMGKGRII